MGLLADELKENQTYTHDSTFFETRSKFYEGQDFRPRQYYFMVFFTDRFKARTQMEIDRCIRQRVQMIETSSKDCTLV